MSEEIPPDLHVSDLLTREDRQALTFLLGVAAGADSQHLNLSLRLARLINAGDKVMPKGVGAAE